MLGRKLKRALIGITILASLPMGVMAKEANGGDSLNNRINYNAVRSSNISKVKKAKPLVVLVDFKDYKYDEIYTKESSDEIKFKKHDIDHYKKMLFNSNSFKTEEGKDLITLRGYYKDQSGGTYDLDGDVYGWITLDKESKYYGGQMMKPDGEMEVDQNVEELVKEAIDKLIEKNDIDLSQYDIEDRNDIDGDGNYDEPDGMIDHLILVSAGIGQATGGGSLQANAIWAHRGKLSEDYEVLYDDSKKIKVNDYTIQSQDTGVGTFAHEYGHDLGLPDEYDTLSTGEDEPVGNWSIMSKGCYCGEMLETEPVAFSPWAKKFLQENIGGNWLNSREIDIDELTPEGMEVEIDQGSIKSSGNDAVIINLPDKSKKIVEPSSGKYMYYSENGNYLSNSMSSNIDLTNVKEAVLKFNTWYDIEDTWDVASVFVKELGNDQWVNIKGNITNAKYSEDALYKHPYGISGKSNGWKSAEFDLNEFTGRKVEIMFKYETDPGNIVESKGIFLDDISILGDGKLIFSDDGEGIERFNLNGFKKSTGTINNKNYYILEWRTHKGVDAALAKTPNKINYDPGLLVWYADDYYDNNWVKIHPGYGFVGVVDAGQKPVISKFIDNNKERNVLDSSYQLRDAAFSLRKGSELNLKDNNFNRVLVDTDLEHQSVFDDRKDYSNVSLPRAGRKLPKYGIKVELIEEVRDGNGIKVKISRNNIEDDKKAPEFIEIKLLESKVREGNPVRLALRANDEESGLSKYAEVYIKGYSTPVNLLLVNDEYVGEFYPNNIGNHVIEKIHLKDIAGNIRKIYNSELNEEINKDYERIDLSKSTFSVVLDESNPFKISFNGNVEAIKRNENLTIKVSAQNGVIEDKNLVVVTALYGENNKLIKLMTEETNGIKYGETRNITMKVEKIEDKVKEIKVFLWDSLENMNYMTAETLTIKVQE